MAQNNPPADLAAQMAQLATQLAMLQGEVTTLCQENVTLTNANATLSTQVAGIITAPPAAHSAGASGAVGGAPAAPIRFATPAMFRHEDILDFLSKTAVNLAPHPLKGSPTAL
jgi:ammonia channel protein AmtB